MSKVIIKTEDFITLSPTLINTMIKACRNDDRNSLQSIFSELGEGWRQSVMNQEINDFFWDYGNAIIRMYSTFKDDSIDEIEINVPK